MKDSLGDRMKENYEDRAKTYLTRRTPVIIRLDGKAFHSFTRGFRRPYDVVFHRAMNNTMLYLCSNIQGCKFGYTQSDEISLLLTDYGTLNTDAWFGYAVQKMCSVAASMATAAFNYYFAREVELVDWEEQSYISKLRQNLYFAMFDARCFNIPESEVANCFIWRQNDATRNAIRSLGQCYFSDRDLHGKSNSEVQEMLMSIHGINFDDMLVAFKRGVCCVRAGLGWTIDMEPPVFTQDREYIEKHMRVSE